ncbi:MAG: bifunctional metallophosphatase/5'-nucleotidase, partial [bacterium]
MNRFFSLIYLLPLFLISPLKTSSFQVIRVLWTSDLHCRVLPTTDFASAGLPRRQLGGWSGLARLIKEKSHSGTLLLDNGDFGFGSPEGDSSQGRLAIWLMNRLGYDVAVLGARDFVGGMNNLEVLARYAGFPILGDPMLDVLLASRVPIFRPYLIKDVNGVKVGILGITDPEVPIYNRKADIARLVIDEPRKQVERYLSAVRAESAEVIIVLGHIDVTTARSIVESLPGIDLIICRSEGEKIEGQIPKSGRGAVVVGGVYGQRLGVADILFHKTERRVYAIESEVLNVSPELAEDSVFEQVLISGLDSAVVHNEVEFFPDELGRLKLAQLVAEAVRQVTKVDLVVLPIWVIESGLDKGTLTRRHLYDAVPYRERLRVVTLPESLLFLLLTPVELDSCLPAPAVAGADLFVRKDVREGLRIADVARFRLLDRRKVVYRVSTNETSLQLTADKEKVVILSE